MIRKPPNLSPPHERLFDFDPLLFVFVWVVQHATETYGDVVTVMDLAHEVSANGASAKALVMRQAALVRAQRR
jgi:hypothetical protein